MKNTSRKMKNSMKGSGDRRADTILFVGRDIIRKLIVPRPKATENKDVVLSLDAYNKIKDDSQEMSRSSGRTRAEDLEAAIHEEIEREASLKSEIERLKNNRISDDLDEEERREKERVLARAEELKREQEDIVKKCNSLITSIKCKAIQDVQIAEKEIIKEELKEYENSMDDMMEEEYKRALHDMQKKREQDWAHKKKYATHIMEQVKENEKQRLKEMERLQREFKLLKLRAEHQTVEEREDWQRKSALNIEVKKQNELINQRIKKEKELEREREELENIKIQQLVKCKLQNEEKSAILDKKERQKCERELARLWKIQNRSRSLLQLKNDIIADRIQEQVQRNWREKELEMVRKKLRETKELASARAQQIKSKHKGQATTILEKEKEAEKNALENELFRNELLESQSKKKQTINEYKKALQEQIIEKELKKREQRDAALKERYDSLTRCEQHDRILRETIRQKIDEIRSYNVPDTYVKHLEKHLNHQRT